MGTEQKKNRGERQVRIRKRRLNGAKEKEGKKDVP
jgi:hypothetical protein